MRHLYQPLLLSILLWQRDAILVQSQDKSNNKRKRRLTRFQQAFQHQQQQSDLWIEKHKHREGGGSACPCSDPSYCQTISSRHNNNRSPIRTSGEVYGFVDAKSSGQKYNWTHISTVAWADSDELMCEAHKHGARAVVAPPSFNLTYMATLSSSKLHLFIEDWVERAVFMVTSRHRDGLVFDFEGPLKTNSPEGQAYVELVNATRQTFHSNDSNPLQVTTCVAWSPDGIDARNFPYAALAEVSDLLYVMDYDTQSQIIQGPCIANANAPYFGMKVGIERYLSLGIHPKQLILGVPWYGYQYPCLKGTKADDRFCPIRQVPFRGVNCSDAAGVEVSYGALLREYYNQTSAARERNGGLRREPYMDASYFNILRQNEDGGDGTVYQSWMDDPTSLIHKFSYARSVGLGGIGPYTFDDLDPVALPEESRQMWSTFDIFWKKEEEVVVEE